ncbi:MAG: hypothetical protein ACREOQ_05640 [Gemmatimonadales bacterium]
MQGPLNSSTEEIGWRASLQPILDAATAARELPDYDEAARQAAVAKELGALWKAPLWVPLLAIPALLIEHGWLLVGAIVVVALWLRYRSRTNARELASALDRKTEYERSTHREAARAFMAEVVEPANRGNILALQKLLERWHEHLPQSANPFSPHLERAPGGGCRIFGRAIGPDDIPTTTPPLGGEKALCLELQMGDVDEDLTELNAACTFSLLLALFGDADRAFVHLRLDIPATPAGEIPWVRVYGRIGYAELQHELSVMETPSGAVRGLGGTIGRRKATRFYAAEDPVVAR